MFPLSLAAPHVHALDLVEAYQRARDYDPQFQSAVAERQGNEATADQARSALFPEASYSRNQQNERGVGSTVQISQPIFSLDRYNTYKQAEPRRELAGATFRTREQELAQRIVKAVTELIRARETAVLNQARIENLEKQSTRANRMYQLGQGTVTDVRDIQVKYEQAKANQITYMVEIRAAERLIASLTGVTPGPDDFKLPQSYRPIPLQPFEYYRTRATEQNPTLQAARQSERIGELEAKRARGAMFPTVAVSHIRSRVSGEEVNTTGFSVAVPINAGNYYATSSAAAAAIRAREERRAAEERMMVELEKTYSLVEANQASLKIKLGAIEAAELSVDANNRGYEAGVRSNVDVINAIQTLFEVKNEYVEALMAQTESLVTLQLLSAVQPNEAVTLTQGFLFEHK